MSASIFSLEISPPPHQPTTAASAISWGLPMSHATSTAGTVNSANQAKMIDQMRTACMTLSSTSNNVKSRDVVNNG